jgi:hypothetical protein
MAPPILCPQEGMNTVFSHGRRAENKKKYGYFLQAFKK